MLRRMLYATAIMTVAVPAWAQQAPVDIPSITITASRPTPGLFTGSTPRERYCMGWTARGMAERGKLNLVQDTVAKAGFLTTPEGREIFQRIVDAILTPKECPGAGTALLPPVQAATIKLAEPGDGQAVAAGAEREAVR